MSEPDSLEDMVERVEWMSPIHYEILEFFDEHDIWISGRALAKNIDYERNYTTKECSTLVEAGILEKDGTIYSLSTEGRGFLSGDLSAEDLQDPT